MRQMYVYILANRPNGILYVEVTHDMASRLNQHRSMAAHSFTRRYAVHRLVHIETFDDPETAIRRERRLKRWPRAWKLDLIERNNPTWQDLAEDLWR